MCMSNESIGQIPVPRVFACSATPHISSPTPGAQAVTITACMGMHNCLLSLVLVILNQAFLKTKILRLFTLVK